MQSAMKQSLGLLVLSLGLAACGGGKKAAGPGADWSARPLDVTISDQVYNVAFTIKSPSGMKLESNDGPAAVTKRWEADVDDAFSEPSFAVAFAAIPATNLTEFVDREVTDGDQVIEQQTTADGFVLVTRSKSGGLIRAQRLKRKGDVHLTCRASQAKTGGVPSPDKTAAWLASICATLVIQ